jgi:hypothetical protein
MHEQNHLIEEKSQNYKDIHTRLYEEKEKYFSRKNYVSNEREESELKSCTF